jgi:hypothetical protein
MFMLTGTFSSILAAPASADTAPGYPGLGYTPLIDIRDVLNIQGPDNTQAVFSVPAGPNEVQSNSVDAASVDFVDKDTSLNQVSIFAAVTVKAPYGHTLMNCNRLGGYTLDEAYTMSIPGLVYGSEPAPQFWYTSMSNQGIVEKAFTFMVYVNEANKTFTVDSVWWPLDLQVPKNPDYNYILNFEVWSVSQQDSSNIVSNILAKLYGYNGWQVIYKNTTPITPSFIIQSGNLNQITVENLLSQDQTINFSGSTRQTGNKSNLVDFSFTKVIDPGVNIVNMPVYSNELDCILYAQTNDFKDAIYVGQGYWLAFNSSGKGISETDVQQPENNNSVSLGTFPLGSAEIQGSVPANGWGGLARTLNPNSLPEDISKYDTLSFWAQGDGSSYSVQLETKTVRDENSHDFHQFVITTGSDWQHYVIPLTSFKQLGTDPSKIVPLTGTDVISVAWETTQAPLSSVSLQIKDAAFINMGINLSIGSSQMSVDGAVYDIDPGYQTAPVIHDGRTFVPIRAIIEALGGTVDWSASSQTLTITLNNTNIVLGIGNKSATVNGVDKALDDAPFISDTGRTMLPLRFITENLGHTVNWDDTSKTITIQ